MGVVGVLKQVIGLKDVMGLHPILGNGLDEVANVLQLEGSRQRQGWEGAGLRDRQVARAEESRMSGLPGANFGSTRLPSSQSPAAIY